MELYKAPPLPDQDEFDAMFSAAILESARHTPEYQLGALEAWESLTRETFKRSFEDLRIPMQVFIGILSETTPELKVDQVRIGIDYSSHAPAGLVVLDETNQAVISAVRVLARRVERFYWSKHRISVMIWTLTKDKCDKESIERDFPYFRPAHAPQG